LLLLIYLSNQIDRSILTFTKRFVQADLNMSEKQYALLAGYGFSLLYAIAGVPMGMQCDELN
jgi:hypothetical protein